MTSDYGTNDNIFRRLESIIRDRKENPSEESYVSSLFNDAPMSLTAKLVEEAYELVHALGDEELQDPEAIPHEAADLVFHLMVSLGWAGVSWESVEQKLEARFGTSGLTEKSQRSI